MLTPETHTEQKSALIYATVKAVVQNGLQNATARTIGAISGVKEVYIYHYFKNKDDLIAQTFNHADESFKKCIFNNLDIINDTSLDYHSRCRAMFDKCWDYILSNRDWTMFYILYYYSSSFLQHSFDAHAKRYEDLCKIMRKAFDAKIDIDTIMLHLLSTILGQARRQINYPRDPQQARDEAFWLIYSVIKYAKGI